jgi:hypothetical protein
MVIEHLVFSAFFRQAAFAFRWAQLRRLACGECRSTYWTLATEEERVVETAFRFTSDAESLGASALDSMRKKAETIAADPGFGYPRAPAAERRHPRRGDGSGAARCAAACCGERARAPCPPPRRGRWSRWSRGDRRGRRSGSCPPPTTPAPAPACG